MKSKFIILTLFLHVIFDQNLQIRSEIDMNYCSLAPPCAEAAGTTDPTVLLDCTILFDVGIQGRSKSLSCCAPENSSVTWYQIKDQKTTVKLDKSDSTFRISNDLRYIVSDELNKINDTAEYACYVNIEGVIYNKNVTLHIMEHEGYENIVPAFELRKKIYVIMDGLDQNIGMLWTAAVAFNSAGKLFNELEVVWTVPEGFTYINGNNLTYRYTGGNRGVIFSSLNISKFDLEPNYTAEYQFKCTYSATGIKEFEEQTYTVAEVSFKPDPAADPTTKYERALIILAICIVLSISVVLIVAQFHIEIRLLLKDKFASFKGDCDYDVFVCYCIEDGHDTVANILLPQLENLGYKSYVFERDALGGEKLLGSLPMILKRSRCMLVVVSPGLKHDGLAMHLCHVGVQEAISKRSLRIITVLPSQMQKQKLTEEESSNNDDDLRTILRVSRSVLLPANCGKKERRFWNKLRLGLPPRHKHVSISNPPTVVACAPSEASASLLANSSKPKSFDI